jgi:F-type H+-transporting ATPase subunit gamma
MSNTIVGLRRKIAIAGDLQSVVRTMKALAASSIGQYEKSVQSLDDYYRAVELGLNASFRERDTAGVAAESERTTGGGDIGVVVFGSDQGLVGRFNEVIAEHVTDTLVDPAGTVFVWAVGERVHAYLADTGFQMAGLFPVPNSIQGVSPLVGQIQYDTELHRVEKGYEETFVFHNRPKKGVIFEPVSRRLLPLDLQWQKEIEELKWPSHILPEVIRSGTSTLRALVREYLFISLFRACVQSLASENESRLAAMERADKNIDELMDNLNGAFNQLRQASIDAELFDVISGYEASRSKTI